MSLVLGVVWLPDLSCTTPLNDTATNYAYRLSRMAGRRRQSVKAPSATPAAEAVP